MEKKKQPENIQSADCSCNNVQESTRTLSRKHLNSMFAVFNYKVSTHHKCAPQGQNTNLT